MEVLRQVVEIDNNQLNLRLPVNFDSKYVEIIVLPFYGNNTENQMKKTPNELTDFQKLLLSAPVMTDDDYNFFLNKKQNLATC